MLERKIAPYGTWKSPITPDLITSEVIRLSQISLEQGNIFWVEMRPGENGRSVLMRRAKDGSLLEVTPPGFNVRTRAHEYGGGAYCVAGEEMYFCNDHDQRIYRKKGKDQPEALTPAGDFRFADGVADQQRGRLICVREDHTSASNEPENSLVAIHLAQPFVLETLASGEDFYSSPVLNPDATRLAYLAWNHPNMPWDGTRLYVAALSESGSVSNCVHVAGSDAESIFQPQWAADGTLYFISDRNGWWNLYRLRNNQVECLIERKAEFGLPQWIFGMSTYAFCGREEAVCSFQQEGQSCLGLVDLKDGTLEILDLPFTHIESVRAEAERIAFLGASPASATAVVTLDPKTRTFDILRRSADLPIASSYFSQPEAITFPAEAGHVAHAFFYAPQNSDFLAPPGELPPLIVKSHGGPTAATSTALELRVQFWTSRGFAVLDVNYGGSTGYGREYRERLAGNWGIVDVDDCVNAAKYVVERGLVDRERVAIAGGSAGGYTTLSALTFRDFFKAGVSYYGICDLEAMTRETHKFEARYLDRLVGPYPEQKQVYRDRSPIHHTETLSCPILVVQGLQDKVVPPSQAEKIVNAVRKRGLPVAYVTFAEEQHGFRKADSIKRSLQAELYFYSRIFEFLPADELSPIEILNLGN